MQKNFEGYGRGVKASCCARRRSAARGIYGLVADVLRAEPRYERAIEAALGERLQLVLVESHAAGLKAVDYLRKAAQGRASFVPLTEMEQLPLVPEAADLPTPEDTVRAVEVVDCAPEHERLRNYLLADVFLCDTLARALALWARNPGERTFVSGDGEVVDKEGIVSGGALEGVADGLLHKRREVQELAETVQDLEARLHLATERVQQLAGRVLRFGHAGEAPGARGARGGALAAPAGARRGPAPGRSRAHRTARPGAPPRDRRTCSNALGEVEREEHSSRDAVAAGEGEQTEREARLRALQGGLLGARRARRSGAGGSDQGKGERGGGRGAARGRGAIAGTAPRIAL